MKISLFSGKGKGGFYLKIFTSSRGIYLYNTFSSHKVRGELRRRAIIIENTKF